MQGVRFRQQTVLLSDMKSLGLAVVHTGGPTPKGFRTPAIGPAFEGKPYAKLLDNGDTEVGFTHRYVVPNPLADSLENIYGVLPKLMVGNFDVLKVINAITYVPKQSKLLLSVFQQQDFLQRSLTGTWTRMIDAMEAGQPIEALKAGLSWPKSAYDMVTANLGPGSRLQIKKTLESTTPLIEGRKGVHFKGIMEGGLSTIDVTILPENIDKAARLAANDAGVMHVKAVWRQVLEFESAMRRGLFEGWYPAAQITDIKNNLAPMLARKYPHLSDEALNGEIAKMVNIKYSTIPASQSAVQTKWLREVLSRVFFAFGESEGLLKQAAQAVKGPNAWYWRRHWLGTFVSTLAVANVIHLASTGKPLPLDRYSPISKDNWGPLPLGYNRDFASPTIGTDFLNRGLSALGLPLAPEFTGRNRTQLLLDVMGQADTAFRLLNPATFFNSRFSVPISAGRNFVKGTDFFNTPHGDVGPDGWFSRIAQLANDMLAPIGIGTGAIQMARKTIPGFDRLITSDEGGIGTAGTILETIGPNVRPEKTTKLLNRYAVAWATENGETQADGPSEDPSQGDGSPITKFSDMEPQQKDRMMLANPELENELAERNALTALRGDETAKSYKELDRIDLDRWTSEEALELQLQNNEIDLDTFRNSYSDIQKVAAAQRATLDNIYQMFKDTGKMPIDRNKRALVQYYQVFENARTKSGVLDFDLLDQEMAKLESDWSKGQSAYVDRNTGRAKHPPLVAEYLSDRDVIDETGYWDTERKIAEEYELLELYEESKVTQDPYFLRDNPFIIVIAKMAKIDNEEKRYNNYELDRALWEWGFVDNPIHPKLWDEVEHMPGTPATMPDTTANMADTPANMYSRQALESAFPKAEGEGNILPGPKQFSVR